MIPLRQGGQVSPILQRPTYLSGAPLPSASPAVVKAVEVSKPFAGLVVGAVVGAVAAYFVPKALDHYFQGSHGDEMDLEIEP